MLIASKKIINKSTMWLLLLFNYKMTSITAINDHKKFLNKKKASDVLKSKYGRMRMRGRWREEDHFWLQVRRKGWERRREMKKNRNKRSKGNLLSVWSFIFSDMPKPNLLVYSYKNKLTNFFFLWNKSKKAVNLFLYDMQQNLVSLWQWR